MIERTITCCYDIRAIVNDEEIRLNGNMQTKHFDYGNCQKNQDDILETIKRTYQEFQQKHISEKEGIVRIKDISIELADIKIIETNH